MPYADRKRGDIICYEYGTYGHIAVQLSGGRVFEQNVNMGGVASKIVAGARVYASRIGSESESWRHDAHIYRLNSYYEGEEFMLADKTNLKYLYLGVYAIDTPDEVLATDGFLGTDFGVATDKVLDYANTKGIAYWQYKPKAEQQIADLNAKVKELQAIIDSSGTLPKGKYLKLNDADLKEVK